jgi:NAD+-dependent farnesol dehydrogenase
MRILVTGGTGYLGAAIVRALARGGHRPVVFARRASGSDLPGELVDGDVRDRAAVTRATRGVDAVCHTAALVSLWRPRREDFHAVNVEGVRCVLDACRELHVRRIVYTSSFLALPPQGRSVPLLANDYQRSKTAGLEIARRAASNGLPIVSLFPGVVYGPGRATEGNLVGRLMRDHLSQRLPGIVGADRIWSFSYIDDVVAAHVSALTLASTGTEHLVGGENAPQGRLFEVLEGLTGVRPPRRIPFAVASAVGHAGEAWARLTGRPPLLTAGAVEIFRHNWPLDSRRSRAALGYPMTPLDAGLQATLAGLGHDRQVR